MSDEQERNIRAFAISLVLMVVGLTDSTWAEQRDNIN